MKNGFHLLMLKPQSSPRSGYNPGQERGPDGGIHAIRDHKTSDEYCKTAKRKLHRAYHLEQKVWNYDIWCSAPL
jgi:hypothetical protein